MATALPIFQPTPIFKDRTDYRQVLIKEMEAGKIPLSLGRDCPVKCEFCYELDHSYRETLDPPKTSDDDWKFILNLHWRLISTDQENHLTAVQTLRRHGRRSQGAPP